MTYQVVVSQHAKDDLRHYYHMAAKRAPETAIRWLDRFESSLQALSVRPERCPIAPEGDLVERTIRQFMFGKGVGKFRVLFAIQGEHVLILHIRRSTMDKATRSELLE